MEKKNNINIAEILKDCPKGTKLYSPICGEVELSHICNDCYKYSIIVKTVMGDSLSFAKDGRLYIQYFNAECLLFPSSEMRAWHQASPRPTTAPGTAIGLQKRHLLHNIRKSEKNSKLCS